MRKPKKENKDCFGGGSGAGVTIQPVAFLTVYQGGARRPRRRVLHVGLPPARSS